VEELNNYLQVLFGKQTGYVYTPIKTKEPKWAQRFFHWPEEKLELHDWILATAHDADVYISPSLFREKNAKKESVSGAQVVWVEMDGVEGVDLSKLPQPNIRVRSSIEGHEHIYWTVPFSPPAVIESINRRLTYGLEADSSGWDITQVLRPPGTHNWKRDKPVTLLSKHVHTTAGLIVPNQLSKFDVFPEPPSIVNIEDITSLPDALEVLKNKSISKEAFNLFRQPTPPKGLRSTVLMQIGYEFAKCGLDHSEIVSLLLEADKTVQKFFERSDQLVRLAEIASIAINKYGSEKQGVTLYSPSEMMALEINLRSLWGEFFMPEFGAMILSGAPAVGKSQLTFQLAMHLAVGKDLLGHACEPSKVIYFSMEMPVNGFKWLLTRQLATFTPDERELLDFNLMITAPGKGLTLEDIERAVDEHRPAVVMYDSLSSISDDDMTSEKEAKRVTSWDIAMREHYRFTSLFIHHNRKANSENKTPFKLSDVYGSTFWSAKVDSVVIMGEFKNELHLFPVKTRYGHLPYFRIHRNTETLTFTTEVPVNNGNRVQPTPNEQTPGSSITF
jgi:hypothetical protein